MCRPWTKASNAFWISLGSVASSPWLNGSFESGVPGVAASRIAEMYSAWSVTAAKSSGPPDSRTV